MTEFASLVLDAHGLSTVAARRPGRMFELLADAHAQDAPVLVPWTVLAETLHGTGKVAREHALSRLDLLPLTEAHYRHAAALMDRTRMGGHTIDALVAAAALGCSRPVVVATSDPRDLRRLLQGVPDVAVVQV